MFITLEGIEGCGKSTQHKLLAQWLRDKEIDFVDTKQPGGTAIGARIRQILLHADHDHMAPACEAMLYLADRAQHHVEVIRPALERGTWVLCDRYQDSTLAYQGGARGIGADKLNAMFQIATDGLQPDLTILLDMDAEAGLRRAQARNVEQDLTVSEGRFEAEALDFHMSVRAAFLEMAAQNPERYVIIDADRDIDAVARHIQHVVAERGGVHV